MEWIEYRGLQGRVQGVMEDFHLQSIHEEIEPIVFIHDPNYFTDILIRIKSEDVPDTIARIQEVWRDVDPVYPLAYTFLDEDFDSLYRAEDQLGTVFAVFSFLAILVACLGLLGLASFSIQQRTREIGIRKVLGAAVSDIALLLSKDFMEVCASGQCHRLAAGVLRHGAMAAELFLCGRNQLRVVFSGWHHRAAHRLVDDRGACINRRAANPSSALRQG